jgi:hypothetical protein
MKSPPVPHEPVFRKLPPEATPEARKKAVLRLIETRGLRPRQAALAAGVGSSTYYDWLDGDREFVSAIEMSEAKFESAMVGSIVHDGLTLRSWRAKLELLERRFPDRYGQRVDLTIDDRSSVDELDERYPTQEALDGAIADLRRNVIDNMPIEDLEAAIAERRNGARP